MINVKELTPQEMSAEELINFYGQNNALKNEYTKIAKPLGDEIKTRVSNGTLKSDEATGSYKISVSNVDKSYFDEVKLIEILKNSVGILDVSSLIKTKEYVDMDALEDAIYNGKIKVEDIAPAKVEKTEQRLSIKEVKKNG